ncbi:MAG: hypothetical protein ACE5GB_11900 [Acidimicrobiales bacterium]
MTDTKLKRHPIRGALYGIPLGLGLALILIGQSVIALGTWPPFLVLIGGVVFGVVWAFVAPAKKPKGAPPATAPEPAPVDAAPVPSQPSLPEPPAAPPSGGLPEPPEPRPEDRGSAT